jgi:hypothetical protein
MIPNSLRISVLALVAAFLGSLPSWGQDAVQTDIGTIDQEGIKASFKEPGYSPYAGRNFPTRVFFGDTHLHTSLSMDARLLGDTLGLEEAYRFARGEEVTSSTGQRVKLSRPLDFLVVADHAEGMGSIAEIERGNPDLLADPTIGRWGDMLAAGGESAAKAAIELIGAFAQGKAPPQMSSPKLAKTVWQGTTIPVAERYNEPGRFTAFIGYEWSALDKGNNLHRVVIFRDGGDKASQVLPLAAIDSANPEDLWKVLLAYEDKTGGSVLAIPHNGNLSNGTMFALADFFGNPLTRQYAETRSRWESVVEVTQTKGDGESHKFLSPNDEFAGYETWDKANLDGSSLKKSEMLQFEYARSALKLGLKIEQELGLNPYKFGMIGSTDAHTSLAAVEEENFFGKHSGSEPSAKRWSHPVFAFPNLKIMGWEQAASGYAAVWATENTREALWDAIKRKEVYATTGSRMMVRFFGGWEFTQSDALSRLPAEIGYTKGVPMGGDLSAAPEGKAPTFLVAALKDPIGANLDRIQIVKGWLDASGEVQEKVHDVVWGDADRRQPGADGKLPPVGNTVDVANAVWTNTIGDPELIAVWTDPVFDPMQRAFYYARVIEIPTPRWTAYDAQRFGVQMPPEVPMTTQERAYTSPIWYTP